MRSLMAMGVLLLCVAAQPSEKLNSIVVIVNNKSISRLELVRAEAEIATNAAHRNINLTPAEARKEALQELLTRILQLQRAEQLGVQVSDSMVDERLAELGRQWDADDERQLALLAQERLGLDAESLRQRAHEELTMGGAFFRDVIQTIAIDDEEITEFLNTEGGFRREYHLYHLLIVGDEDEGKNAQARALAESLRQRIVEGGEPFADLVREYSDGDNAAAGGDLRWRSAGQLPSPFVAVAKTIAVGQTGEIITTRRGFHLLQLAAVRGGADGADIVRTRISHIFLPPGDESRAWELYRDIRGGAVFADLAKKFSTDERSADKGGSLGFLLPGEIPEYFVQPLADINEGEVTPPLTSPFGVHLVRLDEIVSVDMRAVRAQAGYLLRERRALKQRDEWLQKLRSRAYIRIVDPAYADFIDELAG